jgi:hypothetical protein
MDINAETYPYTTEEAHLRAVAEREAECYFTDLTVRELATPKELERATVAYHLLRALDDWVHDRLGTPAPERDLMTPEEYVVYGSTPIDSLVESF